MNLDEKAPSPLPSPAEREREKGRQQVGNVAKFIGSMRENCFGEISPRKAGRGEGEGFLYFQLPTRFGAQ